MKIIRSTEGLKDYRLKLGKEGGVIGFVPTMGSLHPGHLSLIDQAAVTSKFIIVSIFVNPTQFNDPNDLRNYPRDLDADIALLTSHGKTTVLFAPEVKEIYPEPDTRVFNFGNLDKVMEGAHRPGHFNGVAQVVSRLFEIVKPHKAFFGEKDFQQLAVIRNLVKQMNSGIEIVPCPIVREKDGLAMSSRNQLLSADQRAHAVNISRTLFAATALAKSHDVKNLTKWVIDEINKDPFLDVEYFQIADSLSLMPVENWDEPGGKQGCIAVKVGNIRLIDNIKFA